MTEHRLKFLFANHDGTSVELTVPGSTKVGVMKSDLLEKWPSSIEVPNDAAGFKLICMGQVLKDNTTLDDSKIRKFAHPTPVNVAVMPKGFKSKAVPEKPLKNGVQDVAGNCCVVM